jgi:hypothetical protein
MTETDPEHKPDIPIDLGIYDRKTRTGISSSEVVALLLSLLWIGGVSAFLFLAPSGPGATTIDSLGLVIKLLAIFLPIAVIWVGAATARSARLMREESARLQAAIDAMRHSYVTQAQGAGMGVKPSVERKLDEIAAAQKQTDATLATFSSSRSHLPASETPANKPAIVSDEIAPAPIEQTSLELGTQADEIAPPVNMEDFIRALNFPETAEDHEGFNALRRALNDRRVSKLIQSAQDVLTLLSQEGIYMDDLRPDRARPEIWRSFAQGERGRSVAALGGVRDRSSLALTA